MINPREENPFANYNGPVKRSRFIGREDICNAINERVLQDGCVSIVGLPRIGKTSILHHVFIDNHDQLLDQGYLTVSLSAGTPAGETRAERSRALWRMIIEDIYTALRPIQRRVAPDDFELQWTFKDIAEQYTKSESTDINTVVKALRNILKIIKEDLGKRVILCIDEFHNVEEYFEKSDFATLRHLSEDHYATFVIASRKSIEVIELCCHNHDDAYFYNTFREYVVPVFSEDDEREYWAANIGYIPVDSEYREAYIDIVRHFAGTHPCLLNMVNYQALEMLRETDAMVPEDLEVPLARDLAHNLNHQATLLREEGLLDTAIGIIKGPLIVKDQDLLSKQIDRLTKMGFVRRIAAEEKFEMFNMVVGPDFPSPTPDGRVENYSYVCFSNYLTYLFYEKYQPSNVPYYELWERTENRLRDLITCYIEEKYGTDAFYTIYGVKERWVDAMYEEIYRLQGETKASGWKEEINKLMKNKNAQTNYFKTQAQHPLIRFTTTGQIYHQFIDADWNWFKHVFDRETSDDWNNDVFYRLLKIRNAYLHNNIEGIPEQDFADAEALCLEILRQIDTFFYLHAEQNAWR